MHVLVYLPLYWYGYLPLYWYGYLPASFQNALTLTPYVQLLVCKGYRALSQDIGTA